MYFLPKMFLCPSYAARADPILYIDVVNNIERLLDCKAAKKKAGGSQSKSDG